MSRPKKEGGTGKGLPHITVRLDPVLMGLLEKYSTEMKSNKAEFARKLLKEELLRIQVIEPSLEKKLFQEGYDYKKFKDRMYLYQMGINEMRKALSCAESDDNELAKAIAQEANPPKELLARKEYSAGVIDRLDREINLYKSRIKGIAAAIADEREWLEYLGNEQKEQPTAQSTEKIPEELISDPDAPF